MNDEELRAFLESATVGDNGNDDGNDNDEQKPETKPAPAAEPVSSPGSPNAPATSFDELIAPSAGGPGVGAGGSGGDGEEELTPIVLPGPKSSRPQPFPVRPPVRTPEPTTPPTAPLPQTWAPETPPAAAPAAPAATVSPTAAPVTPTPAQPPTAAPVPAPVATPIAASAASAAAAANVAPFGAPTAAMPEFGDDYEKISVVGGEKKPRRLIPWIIVGAGAVVALIVAIVLVGSLSGGDPEPTPTAAPPPATTDQPQTSQPSESPSNGNGSNGNGSTRPTTTPEEDEVPQVEVGPTMNMMVAQWGIQVDLSQKLGPTASYSIPDGVNLQLQTPLIDSLPATCSKEWGMTRVDETTFEVLRPAERCEAAPAVYDELWGLMHAMVQTARPL